MGIHFDGPTHGSNVSRVPPSDLPAVSRWSGFCPAKINLRLAVTGRRPDGYHNLISLAAVVSLGDDLSLAWTPGEKGASLSVSGSTGLSDDDGENLVLRAIRAFRATFDFPGHVEASLIKRVPIGAGLGGGSSDAASTLMGLQAMWGKPLSAAALHSLARKLGADVPFFLGESMAIMRGIGENLEPVPQWKSGLEKWQLILFQPAFGISTPWAYQQLAAGGLYSDSASEEALYTRWETATLRVEDLLKNDFRRVVDARYPTVPVLLSALNSLPGVLAEMSGSGSACFALCATEAAAAMVPRLIHEAWGEEAFCEPVRFW